MPCRMRCVRPGCSRYLQLLCPRPEEEFSKEAAWVERRLGHGAPG
jgi:hypothetical protein